MTRKLLEALKKLVFDLILMRDTVFQYISSFYSEDVFLLGSIFYYYSQNFVVI